MTIWMREISRFLICALGAHAIGYVVIQVLPNPIYAMLGMSSGVGEISENLPHATQTKNYAERLLDTFRGDLGNTLDGVPVWQDLSFAIFASAPRLFFAVLIIASCLVAVAYAPKRVLAPVSNVATALAFLPPYLAPFLSLWLYVAVLPFLPTFSRQAEEILIVLGLAIPAAVFLTAQVASITIRNLDRPFVQNIRSLGAGELAIRHRLLHHVVFEVSPSLEKILVGLFTAIIFAESLFGASGIGSLTARAIRRTDIDLMLSVILMSAIVVGVLRLSAVGIRNLYGLKQ